MSHWLLSIDPGMSSGIALGTYSATEPYTRIGAWQPRGGLEGFLAWLEDWTWSKTREFKDLGLTLTLGFDIEVVCEKFTPLGHGGGGLTLDTVEPLRIEGALIALGLDPAWQRPDAMYWMAKPGDNLAQKKHRAQMLLKRHGLWKTGKEFAHTDGADVNSATLHAISYLRARRHAPTLRTFSGPQT